MMYSVETTTMKDRDVACNDFEAKTITEGGKVFATHTGVDRHWNPETKKFEVFYWAVQFFRDKEGVERENAEMAQRYNSRRRSPAKTDGQGEEVGAAWPDKDDASVLNIKKKDGSYANVPEGDLVASGNDFIFTNPQNNNQFLFVPNAARANNTKAPKYRVYQYTGGQSGSKPTL